MKTLKILNAHGVLVKLANPLQTRAIVKARIKTNRLAARILVHMLWADLIPECYVPPREIRERKSLLPHRSALKKSRTAV